MCNITGHINKISDNESVNIPDKSDNVLDKSDNIPDKSNNVSYNEPYKPDNVLKKVQIKIYDKEELRIKRLEFYDNKKFDS